MGVENKKDMLDVYEKLLDSALNINQQLKEQNDYLYVQLKDTNELLGNEELIIKQTVTRIIEEIRDELHCHFIDEGVTINMLGKDLDTFLDKILVRYHTYADK
jgi:DNA-binding ferritin-like protein (Dps family)